MAIWLPSQLRSRHTACRRGSCAHGSPGNGENFGSFGKSKIIWVSIIGYVYWGVNYRTLWHIVALLCSISNQSYIEHVPWAKPWIQLRNGIDAWTNVISPTNIGFERTKNRDFSSSRDLTNGFKQTWRFSHNFNNKHTDGKHVDGKHVDILNNIGIEFTSLIFFFYQHKKKDPTNKGMNSQETSGMEDDEQADFDHSSYHPDT